MRVLIVEDDASIAKALVRGLEREGFDVLHAATAADALNALPVEFILLDLGLPDRDGVELFHNLRALSAVPIIMVTARGDEEDRVEGLNMGADDYVVKPFGLSELVARIHAVRRRTTSREWESVVQELDVVTIDRRLRTVGVRGVEVALTPKEYGIVEFLTRDPGSVITRQELLENVWGPHWYGTTKMIDVHVASVRKKLGLPHFIETHRGVGFRVSTP